MQNDKTEFPAQEKSPAKSCCLFVAVAVLVCFFLAVAGIASIIVIDTITLRGEGYTFSRRAERYKVACRFIWEDFKEAVSGKHSESSPVEPEAIQSPVDPPESEPESEPES